MKLRIAKKILKNQDTLQYHKAQIAKATTIKGRADRRGQKTQESK